MRATILSGRLTAAAFLAGGLAWAAAAAVPSVVIRPDQPNAVTFASQEARFVRLAILASSGGQPCVDELEVYGPADASNLAAAATGAKAAASSCLPGYAIHQVAHLNDGRYGNGHSWIAATAADAWAQIELPQPATVNKVVFSRDREGQYRDRVPVALEVRVSRDGQQWQTVARVNATAAGPAARTAAPYIPPAPLPDPVTYDGLLRYAFLCERATWQRINATDHLSPLSVDRPALPGGEPYWSKLAHLPPVERVLHQFAAMIERVAAQGVDVTAPRQQLVDLRRQAAAAPAEGPAADALYLAARQAKRQLMFRDPDLAALNRVLFVKRHPYLSSHNYSDVLDSQFRSGGGVCVLDIPRRDGQLQPADARLTTLFDGREGIARDPVAAFDERQIYFAFRPGQSQSGQQEPYWRLMAMSAAGGDAHAITSGPFHDYYPCPLPDGGLAFISTRCRARFLCWRPQAFVLFRMDADGQHIRPLSYANLSEWTPTVMRDGRLLWTRSEYIDKGADFGHTLWAVRPDGTHPELVFGNNTPNCYINGHEVPGTREVLCTLFSHGGDHNGPLGLVNLAAATTTSAAVTNITPDTVPRYNMNWPRQECWRDPIPLSRDYFLASHAPADRFGLYLVDRWGNRELLYLDPEIGSMSPSLLAPRPVPPVLGPAGDPPGDDQPGVFTVADVYQGLEPAVRRGTVRYLRVCQEVRAGLESLPSGEFRRDHGPVFQDFYATPVHKVNGPFGWPTYVAKTALGLAPVETDGSASFYAPAGAVLYFQALDENLNELQRMRSVVQLQSGEHRSCIGCHESRLTAAPAHAPLAMRRPPSHLEPPPWGPVPIAYEKVVQPVWDAQCVRCHDATDKQGLNFAGTLDTERVPASYRTLIAGGWVHYFDMTWKLRHNKAEPLSFGTLQSKLWKVLDAGHYDVRLTRDQMHAVKCWIDMNCPLWSDYTPRPLRPASAGQMTQAGP